MSMFLKVEYIVELKKIFQWNLVRTNMCVLQFMRTLDVPILLPVELIVDRNLWNVGVFYLPSVLNN
jgi:hypothetical protein